MLAADLEHESTTLLDPACVLREHRSRAFNLRIAPRGRATGMVAYRVELEDENGERHVKEGQGRARKGALRVALPVSPRTGYHRLRVRVREGTAERAAEQALIVTPGRCVTPNDLLRDRRVFGLTANLYSVRSRGNWGVGDLSDLARLIAWAAEIGAAFVGVNPLHALRNRGVHVSPYSPVSRVFRNPIYLDVAAVPELGEAPAVRARISAPEFRAAIAALREAGRVDYARVLDQKSEALRELHDVFRTAHERRETPRGRAYAGFLAAEGEALTDFATWCALEERFGKNGDAPGWREWPEALRDPRSDAVRRFREEHAREVDFHRYVQFELERQLATSAEAARAAGLPVGIYQDLALGTRGDGFDPWAFPGLFVTGATLGAPPDDYAPLGQDWGLPPVHPRRLRESGYAYFSRIVRAGLAHAGALRIDHVMGLVRQFWIPEGRPAAEGAYVRFPADDLLGIVALESTRARALIVGEDLGTVPRGLSGTLARWGILSSRVFYFQRTRRGTFLSPSAYPERSLVTASTHDHPPLEGFFAGRDIEVLREAGALPDDKLTAARARRRRETRAIVRRLRAEKLLAAGETALGAARRALVIALLSRTPARLLGVSLDDLAGEEEPVNLPGVPQERHASWTRRMRESIEALRGDPGAAEILAAFDSRAARRGARARGAAPLARNHGPR